MEQQFNENLTEQIKKLKLINCRNHNNGQEEEGEKITHICFDQNCQNNFKICCIDCFTDDHPHPVNKCVKIKHLLEEISSRVQKIDETQNYQVRPQQQFIQIFEKIRKELKILGDNCYQLGDDIYNQGLQNFIYKPEDYNYSESKKILQQILENDINSSTEMFQQNLNNFKKYLNFSKVQAQDINEKINLKNIQTIKQEPLEIMQKKLGIYNEYMLQKINKIKQKISNELKFFEMNDLGPLVNFQINKNHNRNQIQRTELEEGIEFYHQGGVGQDFSRYIVSEQSFDNGEHSFEIEIVNYQNIQRNCDIKVGICEDYLYKEKKFAAMQENQIWKCLTSDCGQNMIFSNNYLNQIMQDQGKLLIKLDFNNENCGFQICDFKGKHILNYSDSKKYKIQGKKIKFYIAFCYGYQVNHIKINKPYIDEY